MLARILGVLLLIGGVAWGVDLIWPLFGGLFGCSARSRSSSWLPGRST